MLSLIIMVGRLVMKPPILIRENVIIFYFYFFIVNEKLRNMLAYHLLKSYEWIYDRDGSMGL